MAFRIMMSATVLLAAPAAAQDTGDQRPRRTRVGVGAQVRPAYPGAERTAVRPWGDLSRARGDDPFGFEAPDESSGFALLSRNGVAVGPALALEGRRRGRDAPGLPEVGRTVEAGGFVQLQLARPIRVRAELRQGIGGHKGLVGSVGADWVWRDGDRWLISAGPRLGWADGRYRRAWYGVRPEGAAATGLPAFRPGAGIDSAGLSSGLLFQFDRRWGLMGYGQYERLVGDAARSPVVRRFGARDQWAGGLGVTYSFGR